MLRRASLLLSFGTAGLLFGILPAAAHCSPPCGPIPVFIEMTLEKATGLTFGAQTELELQGTVSYDVNVYNDGFWYDPQKNPVLSFRVNRHAPWLSAKIEPSQLEVPVNDPRYVSSPSGAEQAHFHWENPIKVILTKDRDPTVEELQEPANVRKDGTARVMITATSTSSLLASELFGSQMGLQEGYAVRELKFIPEINAVAWILGPDGALVPSDGLLPNQPPAGGNAAGLPFVAIGTALAGLLLVVRRRRVP